MTNLEALASNALVEQQKAQVSTTNFYTQLLAEQNRQLDHLRKCVQRWKLRYRRAAGHEDEKLQEQYPEEFPDDFWEDE